MLFRKKIKYKNKKYGRRSLTGAGNAARAEEYEGEQPSCFFIFLRFRAPHGQRLAAGPRQGHGA